MRVAAHTLTTVPGLPEDPQLLMRLGAWLEPEAAHDLKEKLDTLFTQGRPFNLLVRTAAGGDVEADGRVSGGRAILRFRDVAGYRKQLAQIIEQHRQLARDIGLGRALYNALPHPVWIRGGGGQIEWVNKAYVKAVGVASESRGLRSPDRAAGDAPARGADQRPRARRGLSQARAAHHRRRAPPS